MPGGGSGDGCGGGGGDSSSNRRRARGRRVPRPRNMAGAEPFAALLTALRGCYAEVASLETFVRQLPDSGAGEVEVLRGDDAPCYRTFVGQCVVCVPRGARAIPRPVTFQQLSSQSEVITRIVQRLCDKRKKNVLAYGYSLLDENCSEFQIIPSSSIYSYLPNTTTETIRISSLWETLLSRIGDDVMMYLLEHCAIFMLVPPSNCYQVCGQPVYELISHNVDTPTVFVKQRFSKHKRSGLLDYMQKRLMFHRQYLSRLHWWKCRQRLEANVSSMGNKKNNKIQSLMSSYQCSAKTASKQIGVVTEGLEKQSNSGLHLSATTPSLKRKLDREQLEISAKRAKVQEKVRDGKACNITPDVNQGSSKRYGTGYVTSHSVSLIKKKHISQRSNSNMSGPSLARTSCDGKNFVAGENSFLRGVQSNRPLKSSIEMQAESHRKGVEMRICESQLDSAQVKPMEGVSSKWGRQESPLAHLAKKLPNTFLRSAVDIDRKFLLYSRRSFQERFPRSFLLNCLRGCKAGGRRLIETIFLSRNVLGQKHNQSLPHHNWRKKRLPKRYWQMRHIFQKLLKNHGRCPYLVLLKKNCPVRISETSVTKTELTCQAALSGEAEVHEQSKQFGKEPTKSVTSSRSESGHDDVPDNLSAPLAKSVREGSQSEEQNSGEVCDSALGKLLRQHSSHWQVYMFVRECLERVVPEELWGSNHNKCRFLKNVKVFISMGKFVKLSLQQLMWKMRVNDCMWLRLVKGDHFVAAYEHCFREEILAKFLYWLMNTYVLELLRSFFYITETMFQKNMLFYYRKFIWAKLQNIGIRNHFAKVRLRALSSEEIEAVCQKKYIPVASKLRFIPKMNGLRPVVKVSGVVESRALSKESREKKMHHYNARLKNLFSVLDYERTINTSFIGSSVFGRNDIYRTWKKFVTKVLESDGEIPHFYYVKADVSRAYDSIPHNKLVEVVSRILNPEKKTVYCIRRYAMVMVKQRGKSKKFYKRHVSTFKDFMPNMKQFVSHLQENASLQNAIIVEQSLSFNETSSTLFTFFLHVIHNTILQIGSRYYIQCCGIPQGSILSTLLCSLCYGDMENKLLSGIQQDGVLIRLIDDFLLLTPHLTQARTFLRTLAAGIPEYGFLINHKKTVVNFPADDIPECSKLKQLPGCRLIPWCGLLIDTQTLEVYCDYSSYTYTSIRSSLSFNSSRTAGTSMKYKLIRVLKLKCHYLFLDLQINSLRTVVINIYKIFLLQAYRFHACVLQLPFNQQVKNNPHFFLRIISETASCCYAILQAKNRGVTLGNKRASGAFPSEAAEWLCYHAFTVKLGNHKVIYKCLLKPLQTCKMQLCRKIPKDTMALLKTATEPSVTQDFKTIMD
ncbi:telomerase reverse transcriptase isoform X1 [Falco rusticolus]|uniref:telomerase reverse transcriptase isoform X1 n=1 Tax=Falco rusticolus TaxID=120794 RepID=UPI001886861A|nr:telomerase reverse transcriptase isoform X1 [Falco rusticolus]